MAVGLREPYHLGRIVPPVGLWLAAGAGVFSLVTRRKAASFLAVELVAYLIHAVTTVSGLHR